MGRRCSIWHFLSNNLTRAVIIHRPSFLLFSFCTLGLFSWPVKSPPRILTSAIIHFCAPSRRFQPLRGGALLP